MCKKILVCLSVLLTGTVLTSCAKKEETVKPVEISVWHYYNGQQQEAFNRLVEEFNESEGKKKGIQVEAASEGNVSDLEKSVMESLDGKAGAKEAPNIFAAYTDTAYQANKKGMLVDISEYMTKKELDEYVDGYLEEGDLSKDGGLKIFPIAKATEVFVLNKTDWDKFSQATGTDVSALRTIEGVTETAQKYYEWTDSLTDTHEDGKALFGRDAVANYILSGARQLGVDIISLDDKGPALDFDKAVVRKLWDNYYIPFVKGYFSAVGKFRSDDIKTGNIVAMVGSTAGATFFPQEVILGDDISYPIDTEVLPCPQFAQGDKYAVQQGAGMAVIRKDEEGNKASAEFLKWLTQPDRNMEFAALSGYLPVKKSVEKSDIPALKGSSPMTEKIVETGIRTVEENKLYTMPAFEKATDVRILLENSMTDKAKEDRGILTSALASGETAENALAPFLTDENFDSWYNQTKEKLENALK